MSFASQSQGSFSELRDKKEEHKIYAHHKEQKANSAITLTQFRSFQTTVVDSIRYCGKASSQTTPVMKNTCNLIQLNNS